ncbi:hypothetical protein EWM64_g8807 [Hericium alpestre]|uniref:Uncharacterized protein n=1 Tax=Hericium alpestre TaxID=135208 RepID=A0A4Y9ZKS8_9AGAM|nr:hypothetical protein EWM64_g8807 [Hericium alpestre]
MSTKVALITGCSTGGIGFHLCEQFAARGVKVYATAHSVEKMKGFSYSGIETLSLDVNSDKDIRRVVETILAKEEKIDIVVNNAGAGVVAHGPTVDISIEDVQAAFETNTISIIRICKAVLPHMASHKQGLLITISSIAGNVPTPWSGIYSAIKAAVHSITQTLQMECRLFNIDVMLVMPGGVKSNFTDNYLIRFHLPEDSLYSHYLPNILARILLSQMEAMPMDEFA